MSKKQKSKLSDTLLAYPGQIASNKNQPHINEIVKVASENDIRVCVGRQHYGFYLGRRNGHGSGILIS
jgi:hypothetical protein